MVRKRDIQNPQLREALDQVKSIMNGNGFAGACMLVSEEEAAFCYVMDAPWSGISADPTSQFRFRLSILPSIGDTPEKLHKRAEGIVHTICQLADFGAITMDWMEQAKAGLRKEGFEFKHVPFNGDVIPHIRLVPVTKA